MPDFFPDLPFHLGLSESLIKAGYQIPNLDRFSRMADEAFEAFAAGDVARAVEAFESFEAFEAQVDQAHAMARDFADDRRRRGVALLPADAELVATIAEGVALMAALNKLIQKFREQLRAKRGHP